MGGHRLVCAVGDIHGRLDLLDRALAAFDARIGHETGRLIFLGDYVDRGPDSSGVLGLLIELERAHGATCLKGNHEAMMVEAVRSGEALPLAWWIENGGAHTLRSYGLRSAEPDELSRIPLEHLDWMASRPLIHRDPHRVYVHAGLAPFKALDDQDEASCLWTRTAFLNASPDDLSAEHVVHGHTPHLRPELLPHRTNLDTGAYATGVLTIGVFDAAVPGGPIEVWPIV